MFYAVSFVKTAVSLSVAAGIGDSVYQIINNKKFNKRNAKASWNGSQTAKVALAAAALGPVIATPYSLLAHPNVGNLIATSLSFAVAEATVMPLLYLWKDNHIRHFKPYLPLLLVGTGVGSLACSAVLSAVFGHLAFGSNIAAFGCAFPENIVFVLGLGTSSFLYYSLIHQIGLTSVSTYPEEMHALVGYSQLAGMVSAAGLFTVAMFPIDTYPFLNLIGADVFFLSGILYQLMLTYQMHAYSLEQDLSTQEETLLRVRLGINAVTMGSAFLVQPFISSGNAPMAAGMQLASCLAWAFYFATYHDEFQELSDPEEAKGSSSAEWLLGKLLPDNLFQRVREWTGSGDADEGDEDGGEEATATSSLAAVSPKDAKEAKQGTAFDPSGPSTAAAEGKPWAGLADPVPHRVLQSSRHTAGAGAASVWGGSGGSDGMDSSSPVFAAPPPAAAPYNAEQQQLQQQQQQNFMQAEFASAAAYSDLGASAPFANDSADPFTVPPPASSDEPVYTGKYGSYA